jgi:hypothetical protein
MTFQKDSPVLPEPLTLVVGHILTSQYEEVIESLCCGN